MSLDPYAIGGAFAAVIGAAATAVRSITKNFLAAGAAKDERFLGALEQSQARNEKFLGNHMSGNTRALESVATNLAVLNEHTDRLHDDNIEAARLLLSADKHVTRKVEEQNMVTTKKLAKANTERIAKLEAKDEE